MSISEPETKGKVVLETTIGPIDIELWPKESPKATRNFVQLVLDGFYDNNLFHRFIPNFLVQTGDPFDDGKNVTAYDNEPFPIEVHPRLRFSYSGIVACAGIPLDAKMNAAQFFITLDAAPELNKKHTIFGKVVGTSIFNLLRVNNMPLAEGCDDKFELAPKIITAKIISNPYDDVIPRGIFWSHTTPGMYSQDKNAVEDRKNSLKAVINKKLLSFGEEEDEDEEMVPEIKYHSNPNPGFQCLEIQIADVDPKYTNTANLRDYTGIGNNIAKNEIDDDNENSKNIIVDKKNNSEENSMREKYDFQETPVTEKLKKGLSKSQKISKKREKSKINEKKLLENENLRWHARMKEKQIEWEKAEKKVQAYENLKKRKRQEDSNDDIKIKRNPDEEDISVHKKKVIHSKHHEKKIDNKNYKSPEEDSLGHKKSNSIKFKPKNHSNRKRMSEKDEDLLLAKLSVFEKGLTKAAKYDPLVFDKINSQQQETQEYLIIDSMEDEKKWKKT